jgi:hypothetical protein
VWISLAGPHFMLLSFGCTALASAPATAGGAPSSSATLATPTTGVVDLVVVALAVVFGSLVLLLVARILNARRKETKS